LVLGVVKPGVEEPVIVPRASGTRMLLTLSASLTPSNVNVAVPPPDVIVTAFVPEPVQGTTAKQVKVPWVVSATSKTMSPFGRMVYGSAVAVPLRESAMRKGPAS
jgi:hypothetical protein